MKIVVTSIFVDNQDKALLFYTNVLGFVKKTEIPMGEHRWLTVVEPADPDGVELLLEPGCHPAVAPFKRALVEDWIPFTSFGVERARCPCHRSSRPGDLRSVSNTLAGPPLRGPLFMIATLGWMAQTNCGELDRSRP